MKTILVFLLCVAAAAANPLKFGFRYGFPEGRVVGGQDAQPHSAPWILSLEWVIFGSSHMCGASIIGGDWVITAAHCLPPFGSIDVVAGRHDLSASESTEQRRRVDRTWRHENYVGGVAPFDIALLHVSSPFVFNEAVSVIGLPVSDTIHHGIVTLHGWGSTSTSSIPSYPDILQTVSKPIVPWNQCQSALGGPSGSPLHETNVCTGPLTGGISACSGDSGGPLVQNNELVGIVSWGIIPCGSAGWPSVYVRMSAFNEWVEENQNRFYSEILLK